MSSQRRRSVASGFAALRGGAAIILLLTAVTVVLSILAAAPLGPSLDDSFARTLAGDHLLLNDPKFATSDFFDFLHEKRAAIGGVAAASRWAALLILLQQILVAGGIVSVLGRPGRFTAPEFVAGVRHNAWHNIKCFLIFLVAGAVSIGLWIALAAGVDRRGFRNIPPGAAVRLAWTIFAAAVALLLYAVLSLLHDFARASRRSDPSIGAWGAFGHARRTLSGRWPGALGLFLFWLVFGGALLTGGVALEWFAPAVSAPAISLHIVLQIAVLAIRPAVRVAAWGSYLSLYDHAASPPAPIVPEPPPPAGPPILTLEDQPLV